jgi:hypothetical protein
VGTYRQCELTKGQSVTIAWIDADAAKVGNEVELLTADGEFWRVAAVYGTMDGADLLAKQRADRNPFPSLVNA